MKNIFLSILGVILFIALFLAIDYSGMLWQGFIAPKKENIRRDVFEKTRSYNEGKLQDLAKYMYEYRKAKTEDDREAIASIVRHQFANYNDKNMSYEMQSFLGKIKYGE